MRLLVMSFQLLMELVNPLARIYVHGGIDGASRLGYTTMKVREAIRLIEDDGWFLARMKGSHRADYGRRTAAPDTTMPPRSGMSTVMRLGRPIASPWRIRSRAGALTSPAARR